MKAMKCPNVTLHAIRNAMGIEISLVILSKPAIVLRKGIPCHGHQQQKQCVEMPMT